MRWPSPGPPMCTTLPAQVSSTGLMRSKTVSVAPTMVSSVPSQASLGVRPSGASTKSTPIAASSPAMADVEVGSEVEQSMTTEPLLRPWISPSGPRTIASTWGEPVTQMKTMLLRSATSFGERASPAPRAIRSSTGARLLRPITVSL